MTINTIVRRKSPFMDEVVAAVAGIRPGMVLTRDTTDARVRICAAADRPFGIADINYRVGRTGTYAINDIVPAVFGDLEVFLTFQNNVAPAAAAGLAIGQTVFTTAGGNVDGFAAAGSTAVGIARETIAPIAAGATATVRVRLVI